MSEIEHLKRHLEKEEAHHVQHARQAVAQAIQGVVTKAPPPEHLFNPISLADLPNMVSRNVAKNAPSRIVRLSTMYLHSNWYPLRRTFYKYLVHSLQADNKLAAARLMRDIAELRQRVGQIEARLANELKRKRQAELDIVRLRKELSATKSCVASLRMPPPPLRKQCSKFA
ncbi:hypothetical protein O3G_MSEX011707 [Manduca sexta]|uniref:Uncharacterized protein n=1 Tax=Manduca sexta TaxID=7130 RepID=A0A921ZL12_MANSE|nr:hypothetical protein O3G_MSEX011707 [Manduca sexta]KAG6459972.1 hypothetical protein O3G_MSEX011707 [Manduca sexta]